MTRPLLAVHGHFYQPERRDPFTGQMPPQAAAAPYRDWNSRINAECYKPNAERGNLRHMTFDLGPTLASWLATHDPNTLQGFVASDRPAQHGGSAVARPPGRHGAGDAARTAAGADAADPARGGDADPDGPPPARGDAIAQAFHHSILPLASLEDRRTEIRWGLRDFLLRFGRPASGIWLPETAVDVPTLRILAEESIRYTILAPWQAADPRLDTRRPYRLELGGGRAITVVFYDAALSAAASFEPEATRNADSFSRERVLPRLAGAWFPDGSTPLALIATDGELYGHHQKFRDLFLKRLVDPGPDVPDRGFDVTTLGRVVGDTPPTAFPVTQIVERTSWSCHHGVARWTAECPDAADGRWKGPLRAAMERLAGAIDGIVLHESRDWLDEADFWRARDAYVDVVVGVEPAAAFGARILPGASPDSRRALLTFLEAERWRLAMFASDGWFWDDPVRPETKQVMLAAARAARLIDETVGSSLESRFVDDLALFSSPSRRVDGRAIFLEALAASRPGR